MTRRPRPVEEERVDEQASAMPPPTIFFESDSSGAEERSPPFKDEGTQCDDWQRYANDELENEIACRLSSIDIALITVAWIPLHRNNEMREEHKRAGAICSWLREAVVDPTGERLSELVLVLPYMAGDVAAKNSAADGRRIRQATTVAIEVGLAWRSGCSAQRAHVQREAGICWH